MKIFYYGLLLAILWPHFIGGQITLDQQAKVDALFQKYNRTDMPGCALAIVNRGKIIYEKGYGMADLEHGIAIDPSTVFYAGSISKQFVTAAALLLTEQGKLDLDAVITNYLPDFDLHGVEITVRHLIYHTSGIRDYFQILEKEKFNYLNDIEVDTIFNLISGQSTLDFSPGEKYQYSNSGYLLLAMIIEEVSGSTLARFIRKEIFDPLGMNQSMFLDDNRKIVKNRAWGYYQNVEDQIENMIMRFDLVGSGGLYTTVRDLAKWDQNLYQSQIGSESFLDSLLTNGRLNNGQDIKYAFAIRKDNFRGVPVIGHSGSLGGYRAQFTQFPEQEFSVIILSNLANCKPGEMAQSIANIFLSDYFVR